MKRKVLDGTAEVDEDIQVRHCPKDRSGCERSASMSGGSDCPGDTGPEHGLRKGIHGRG